MITYNGDLYTSTDISENYISVILNNIFDACKTFCHIKCVTVCYLHKLNKCTFRELKKN